MTVEDIVKEAGEIGKRLNKSLNYLATFDRTNPDYLFHNAKALQYLSHFLDQKQDRVFNFYVHIYEEIVTMKNEVPR